MENKSTDTGWGWYGSRLIHYPKRHLGLRILVVYPAPGVAEYVGVYEDYARAVAVADTFKPRCCYSIIG